MGALADVTVDTRARVDEEAHREFGPDESVWTPGQHREYDIRLDAARYDPQVVA